MTRPPPRSTLFPSTPPSQSPRVSRQLVLVPHRDPDVGPQVQREGVPEGLSEEADGEPHPRVTEGGPRRRRAHAVEGGAVLDRKSTRLNSSHANISYAVFCLK